MSENGERLPRQWAPFEPGNHAATVSHGTRSPRLVSARASELRAEMAHVPWLQESDETALDVLASCMARYRMLDEYITAVAEADGVAAVRPYLWSEVTRAEGNLLKAINDLGLTPAGRGKLARDLGVAHHFAGGLTDLAAEGRRLREQHRTPPIPSD